MKKLPLAVAIASAIGAAGALADNYDDMGGFRSAWLLPEVTHNGSGDTTVAGIIGNCQWGGRVYWAYFDKNSKHVTDDKFDLTKNDFHAFNWSDPLISGSGTEGLEGYIVMAVSTPTASTASPDSDLDSLDEECINVAAFHVNLADDDVEFRPVIAVEKSDFCISPSVCGSYSVPSITLTTVTDDPIKRLDNGADAGETLYMRYSIDGIDDNDVGTDIKIWSAGHLEKAQGGVYTWQMYNTEQDNKSITVTLAGELNNVDPEKITGAPPDFLDGFFIWENTGTNPGLPDLSNTNTNNGAFADPTEGDGFFSYSKIFHSGFRAKQTILNPVVTD